MAETKKISAEEERRRARFKANYAYLILAAIAIILAGANVMFTITATTRNAHRFCEVVTSVVALTEKPGPGLSRALILQQEAFHAMYLRLDRSLGCSGP